MKKKVVCIVLTVLCALCITVAGVLGGISIGAEAEVTPAIRVVKPEDSNIYDDNAASVLQSYLSRIIGSDVALVTDAEGAQANEICVGNTNRLASAVDTTGWKNGQYVITADANGVSVVGYRGGATRGVYRFLEEYCGCHWYSDDEVVIPENSELTLPTSGTIEYSPYFEYTETDWNSGDVEFSLANGLNGRAYRSLSEAQGNTVGYLSWLCHTLSTEFCSAGQYFDSHPEYFAYRDGERQRTKTQLCLTNPEVLEILKNEVIALLGSDTSVEGIVSLTQDDNYNYCECENCRRYAAEHGGEQSAAIVNMANYVAKAVKAAGYNNVLIDTFAYQYSRKAPTGLTIEDNVIIRLCTIECCFSHALDDPNCEANVDLMSDLRDWKELTNRIYVWDYTTNYAQTTGYFPDFGTLQRNAQVFYENNVLGVYEEGNYYVGNCDTEFGALRRYLIAKVLQNPYCDYQAEMKAFCNAYYGAAGEYIYDFINDTSANAAAAEEHMRIYVDMSETMTVSEEQFKVYDGYWTSAKTAVAEDSKSLARVLRSEISWRFWKASNFMGEFSGELSVTRFENNEKLYQDLLDYGVGQLCEGGNMEVAKNYRLLRSEDWRRGYTLQDFIGDWASWQFGSSDGLASLITAGIIGVGVIISFVA